jgi:aminoglycoside phosphotransferase (APT) family kinase protein
MNIILQLLDPEYVKKLFTEKLLPLAPDMVEIKHVLVEPVKKNIWNTTYHVVFRFITTFTKQTGGEETWQIYATAHSSEPRESVHEALNYLWQSNFSQGGLSVPRPLFYSPEFRAAFYRGVEGKLLYKSIKENNFAEIESGVAKTAAWFAKLHALPTKNVKNFNPHNSRIATVVPGREHILKKTGELYPEFLSIYERLYHLFTLREDSFLDTSERLWLVHGDAHPENVIMTADHKLVMVDFTDLCLSDFARDLGTFLQQLDYMAKHKTNDLVYTEKIKKLFLNSYLEFAKVKMDESLEARINNYYYWTALRTASFFLFKHDAQPESARPLLTMICEKLNVKIN